MSRYKQPYSLYKRGKYWYYRTYDNLGVRTTAKTTGCTSKGAAKEYCDKLFLLGALNQTNKTFQEYALHFYDDNSPYVKDRATPLTFNALRGLRICLKNYIMPYFKDKRIADINYTAIKQFRIYMLENYAVSTTISTMSNLKHIFDSAFRDRLIAVNPFEYLEPIAATQNSRDSFTIEEIKFIVSNIPEEFRKLIILMAITGMRISEAIGVTSEDVKQKDYLYYIELKRQLNHGHYVELKNKIARDIPIPKEAVKYIGFDCTRLSALYRYFEPVKKQIKDYEKRNLSFHSLRHFFITSAKASNINSTKVETIAGHSLRGIEKVYTNYKVEDLFDIVAWQINTLLLINN